MLEKIKALFTKKAREERSNRTLFIWMLAAGIVALGAAFTLTVEKFHLYEEPDAVLSCSVNAVLDCSAVMETWQASVFGFPNMLIGLMAFSVVITVAVLGLSKVVFPRWFALAATGGYLLGLIFSYWLFFSSVYVIQILCPWCLLVTASTTIIFSTMLHYTLRHNLLGLNKKRNAKVQKFLDEGYHQMIVIGWLAVLVALVFLQFGGDLFA